MAGKGQTISQLTNRTELKGTEEIPFQEGVSNGKFTAEAIKKFASDVYICPGVFQKTDGWTTTDVESIVGNWDEFEDALNNKVIFVKIPIADTDSGLLMAKTIFIRDILMTVSDDAVVYMYYITTESITLNKIYTYITNENIIDNLYSSSASYPLSANQGKVLNEKIEELITKTETTTETTKELQANTYYVFGEVETLTLTLAAGEDGVMSEYMFEFTSADTPTVITPIEGIEWRGDAIEANKYYQASIVRGIGILVGRDIV